jgi:hypothetical protein
MFDIVGTGTLEQVHQNVATILDILHCLWGFSNTVRKLDQFPSSSVKKGRFLLNWGR